MIEVGVRELKAGISGYLRRVAQGEHIRVTLRGRAVADLVPPSQTSGRDRWDELVAQGRIAPADRPWPRTPAAPQSVRRSASEHILAEREAER